jgi:hypothetical protein
MRTLDLANANLSSLTSRHLLRQVWLSHLAGACGCHSGHPRWLHHNVHLAVVRPSLFLGTVPSQVQKTGDDRECDNPATPNLGYLGFQCPWGET